MRSTRAACDQRAPVHHLTSTTRTASGMAERKAATAAMAPWCRARNLSALQTKKFGGGGQGKGAGGRSATVVPRQGPQRPAGREGVAYGAMGGAQGRNEGWGYEEERSGLHVAPRSDVTLGTACRSRTVEQARRASRGRGRAGDWDRQCATPAGAHRCRHWRAKSASKKGMSATTCGATRFSRPRGLGIGPGAPMRTHTPGRAMARPCGAARCATGASHRQPSSSPPPPPPSTSPHLDHAREGGAGVVRPQQALHAPPQQPPQRRRRLERRAVAAVPPHALHALHDQAAAVITVSERGAKRGRLHGHGGGGGTAGDVRRRWGVGVRVPLRAGE